MSRNLCLFEDEEFGNFYPLSYTRPVFELLCGMTSLRAKVAPLAGDGKLALLCRQHVAHVARRLVPEAAVNEPQALSGDACVFVNGRVLLPKGPCDHGPDVGQTIVADGRVVCAHLSAESVERIAPKLQAPLCGDVLCEGQEVIEAESSPLVPYIWELMLRNGDVITEEFPRLANSPSSGVMEDGVYISGGDRESVFLGEGTIVHSGTVLDVSEGPIYIGPDSTVRGPTIIQGPACFGRNTLIDGAKVREGCTLGPVCKVGGELEATIFQGCSNKHHEGFIGHAYLGEWVNAGALATNSDLKNNYKPVAVQLTADAPPIDTGSLFVGSMIGDHTKLGIGSLLNTGTTVGVACNIFGGGGVPPKFVPSFSWGGAHGFVEHRIDKAFETAVAVMGRRDIELTDEDRQMLQTVHDLSAKEREICSVNS